MFGTTMRAALPYVAIPLVPALAHLVFPVLMLLKLPAVAALSKIGEAACSKDCMALTMTVGVATATSCAGSYLKRSVPVDSAAAEDLSCDQWPGAGREPSLPVGVTSATSCVRNGHDQIQNTGHAQQDVSSSDLKQMKASCEGLEVELSKVRDFVEKELMKILFNDSQPHPAARLPL